MIAVSSGEEYTVISSLWKEGCHLVGGGILGGLVGIGFYKAFAAAAGIIITAAIIVTFGFFLFGITPKTIWINLKYSYKMQRERRLAAAERAAAEREFEYEENGDDTIVPPETTEPFDSAKPFDTAVPNPDFDMNIGDEFNETAENPTITPVEEPAESTEKNVYNRYGEIDLGAIFVDESEAAEDTEGGGIPIGDILSDETDGEEEAETATLTVTTDDAGVTPPAPKPKVIKKVQYRFPPLSLLAPPEKKKNEDVGAELRANAQKLVDTLKSFHVNVTVASVSRGPTITRYELIPEAGTRVRSIANLVDDISLSLATSGIRIEAPIPGKAAVGIEVPNKSVSTVTLRELIENKTFSEAKSKLAVCLGKDVGGTPIVFDIAKMPHLLIAGATGMGKSVCINSIITSILYKATPEEVKLILIDPKKVEFNIYNGIPHLQIPVVSEPKKAAGALHWAVTEMERRYELIEEVGARKIEPYNEIAKQRGLEVLPYTVIIIDELADLMMTAPDAVEDSICRLAQKARAAGMHIIIGTQRPSVDVITGLIKANIPSRIAFTVASQVDSRTIIDIAGAEKLIGRGDMLYYPVGLSKPMRAQGAFVSEDEVEQITAFVKQSVGETEYDADIIESIEREAQAIGNSGKKSGGEAAADDGAGDPKLRDALEIATDTGKISTSLLQRKLSIGYGRAAKIIDIMEARGFVSAPDGQKPREVLITKTQFREMVVNNDERLN
ncbi:MAG: DNA translocase FtsK [Clostridia bacterium]|nr:DNA translocase FtsK [Clostridia bacterium]